MGTGGGGETDQRVEQEPGDYLSLLRSAADALEAAPGSEVRGTFFPNWPFDENELDKPEVTRAIRRAARAVFARKTETGEGGRRVSKQELSHLIHYLASMLE